MTNFNNTLFFAADDGIKGYELWKSDGTMTGTIRVTDINPDSASSLPKSFVEVNGTLFFTAKDGRSGRELWAYRQVEVTNRDYLPLIMKNSGPG